MPPVGRLIPAARQTNWAPSEKRTYKIKLRVKIPENLAAGLSRGLRKARRNKAMPTTTTVRGSTDGARRISASIEENEGRDSTRRDSQVVDILEPIVEAEEQLLQRRKEKFEMLQKAFQEKDDEIARLQGELAQASRENQTQKLEFRKELNLFKRERNELREERKQTQDQILELKEDVRRLKATSEGSKRKLAEYLKDIGFTKEDHDTATDPSDAATSAIRPTLDTQDARIDNTHQDFMKRQVDSILYEANDPVLGSTSNPLLIAEYAVDAEDDLMGETITVRVSRTPESVTPLPSSS